MTSEDTSNEKAQKPKRPSRPPKPPLTVERLSTNASERARLVAASVLEVLAGLRSPTDAATALGLAPVRYYQLETRALGGLLKACEPAEHGRPRVGKDGDEKLQDENKNLKQDNHRLSQELARLQALLRTARSAFGLKPPTPPAVAKVKGGKRIRKPRVRALRLAGIVRKGSVSSPVTDSVEIQQPVSS